MVQEQRKFEIGRSCISDPKSETSNWTGNPSPVGQSSLTVSDFGSEMQDSSNFKLLIFVSRLYCFGPSPFFARNSRIAR
jgi:hypothetical protein